MPCMTHRVSLCRPCVRCAATMSDVCGLWNAADYDVSIGTEYKSQRAS